MPSNTFNNTPGKEASDGKDTSNKSTSPKSAASEEDIPKTPAVTRDDGVILNTDFTNLTVQDDEQIEVRADATGSYSTTSETKKARGVYSPPFVRRNAGSSSSNPFNSPTHVLSHGQTSSGRKKQAMNAQWRSSASSSGSGCASSYNQMMANASSDREACRSEDPQANYPPSACIFVGNLPQSQTDASLDVDVTTIFRRFGHCWVKVKRDPRGMPMAFVQYRDADHAATAIRQGGGIDINGRPCRVEKGKANRSYFFERRYGPALTVNDAYRLLGRFGLIEEAHVASAVERAQLNSGEGVIITLAFYDDGATACHEFRNSELYRMTAIRTMTNYNTSSSRRNQGATPEQVAFALSNDTERRSVHVANLPVGVTESQIRDLFARFGPINEIEIREYRSRYEPYSTRVFAFIEFALDGSVDEAIRCNHNLHYVSMVLKVTQKNTHKEPDRDPPRRTAAVSYAPLSRAAPPPRRVGSVITPPTIGRPARQTMTQNPSPAQPAPGFMMQTPSPTQPAPGFMMQTPGYSPYYAANPSDPSALYYSAAYVPPAWMYSYGHVAPANNTSPPQSQNYNYGYVAPANGASPPQPQNYGYGYGYGYPGYPSYPSYTGQYPAGTIYNTPAAALAAQRTDSSHAHPDLIATTTETEESSTTEAPADQPAASSEVGESA